MGGRLINEGRCLRMNVCAIAKERSNTCATPAVFTLTTIKIPDTHASARKKRTFVGADQRPLLTPMICIAGFHRLGPKCANDAKTNNRPPQITTPAGAKSTEQDVRNLRPLYAKLFILNVTVNYFRLR